MSEIIRNIEPEIITQFKSESVLLLIGARQVGKTTLLKVCKKVLEQRGEVVYDLTLEDPHLLADLDEHPDNIFKYIQKKGDARQFLLLDEIQYLKNPSNFLKYLNDQYSKSLKIICTGSSAFYIDQKFKDSLAGRKRVIHIHPLSFSEFLQKRSPDLSIKVAEKGYLQTKEKKNWLIPDKKALLQYWVEYSTFGGYPRVVQEENFDEKRLLLKELRQSFLKKDIYESGVRNELKFYQLVKLLASQCGGLLNLNEVSNTLGISRSSVDHYIYVLRKSFIIDICVTFQNNYRKELTKMPKVFMADQGLRNSILNSFKPLSERSDGGGSFENLFFSEVLKSGYSDIKYWRTQDLHEVDFVIDESDAFELKLNSNKFKAKKYERFTSTYPDIPLKLVVPEDKKELDIFDFSR